METSKAIAAFLIRGRARKLSRKTLEAYSWALGYLRELQVLPRDPGDVELVLDLSAGRLGDESQFDLWRRMRTFFRWTSARYELVNPMERVNPRTGQLELLVARPIRAKNLPRDLGLEQVHELLDRGCRDRRDQVMILLPLDTGLRLSEIAFLTKPDIAPEVIRVFGKGRKAREVPLSSEVLHGLMFLGTQDFPWVDAGRQRLTWEGVKTAYRRIFARAGVKAGVHSLRHTMATTYLRRGGDLYRLSRILGHSNVKTTEIYLHLVHEDLVIEHRRISPASEFMSGMRRLL